MSLAQQLIENMSLLAVVWVMLLFGIAKLVDIIFNSSEVYIKRSNGRLEESRLATRFCRVVSNNIITKHCSSDNKNSLYWSEIYTIVKNKETNAIIALDNIHEYIKDSLERKYGVEEARIRYRLVKDLYSELIENLNNVNIRTPPYLTYFVYSKWISRALVNL